MTPDERIAHSLGCRKRWLLAKPPLACPVCRGGGLELRSYERFPSRWVCACGTAFKYEPGPMATPIVKPVQMGPNYTLLLPARWSKCD